MITEDLYFWLVNREKTRAISLDPGRLDRRHEVKRQLWNTATKKDAAGKATPQS